jgi:hypothetical protein
MTRVGAAAGEIRGSFPFATLEGQDDNEKPKMIAKTGICYLLFTESLRLGWV